MVLASGSYVETSHWHIHVCMEFINCAQPQPIWNPIYENIIVQMRNTMTMMIKEHIYVTPKSNRSNQLISFFLLRLIRPKMPQIYYVGEYL